MAVKLFEAPAIARLEHQVNEFLKTLDPKNVLDVTFYFHLYGKYAAVRFKL